MNLSLLKQVCAEALKNPKEPLKQGWRWAQIHMTPTVFKHAMSTWPPFVGAGIKVTHISDDYTFARTQLKDYIVNRNIHGSHFGGSIQAMADPLYTTMLSHILDKRFVVWDKLATTKFIRPGYGTLTADFHLDETEIETASQKALRTGRYVLKKKVEIKNAGGEVVAIIDKEIVVLLKEGFREYN